MLHAVDGAVPPPADSAARAPAKRQRVGWGRAPVQSDTCHRTICMARMLVSLSPDIRRPTTATPLIHMRPHEP